MHIPQDMALDRLPQNIKGVTNDLIALIESKDPGAIGELPRLTVIIADQFITEEHRLGPQEDAHFGWVMYQLADMTRKSLGIHAALQLYEEARCAFRYARGHISTAHQIVLEVGQYISHEEYFRKFSEAVHEYADLELSEGLLRDLPYLPEIVEKARMIRSEL